MQAQPGSRFPAGKLCFVRLLLVCFCFQTHLFPRLSISVLIILYSVFVFVNFHGFKNVELFTLVFRKKEPCWFAQQDSYPSESLFLFGFKNHQLTQDIVCNNDNNRNQQLGKPEIEIHHIHYETHQCNLHYASCYP